jgi:SAM-dependent methyltransferase
MDPPSPLLVEFASKLMPGRALDLACGSGRNAIWLAQQGWSVTAVDKAQSAIGWAVRADLEAGEFPIEEGVWDLIIMAHYLQRDLFEPVKRGLHPGGIAIVIVHLFEPGHENSRFSLHAGELAGYFTGWEILHSREGKPVHNPQGRALAEIVARKPSPVRSI